MGSMGLGNGSEWDWARGLGDGIYGNGEWEQVGLGEGIGEWGMGGSGREWEGIEGWEWDDLKRSTIDLSPGIRDYRGPRVAGGGDDPGNGSGSNPGGCDRGQNTGERVNPRDRKFAHFSHHLPPGGCRWPWQ